VAQLSAFGLTVEVPPAWEARIFVRPEDGEVATAAYEGKPAPPGERTYPLLQLSTVSMPTDVGDYGSGVVERLGPTGLFLVVKEFAPSSVGTKLFARAGMPLPLDPAQFSADSLQRTLPGQAGVQVFFTEGGRALCLYIVIGSIARRQELVALASATLATLAVTAAAPTSVPTTAPPTAPTIDGPPPTSVPPTVPPTTPTPTAPTPTTAPAPTTTTGLP